MGFLKFGWVIFPMLMAGMMKDKEPTVQRNTAVNPPTVAIAGTYSQSVRVPLGDSVLIFVSGQVAIDKSGALVGKGDAQAQAEQVFKNIAEILKANEADFGDVAKMNIYVTNMADRPAIASVRKKYLRDPLPASTFVQVQSLVEKDWLLEIELVAAKHAVKNPPRH